MKTITAMLLAATLTVSLAGCGGGGDEASAPEETATVDYNSMSLEDLEAQAKEEGEVASVGMPDTSILFQYSTFSSSLSPSSSS